MINYTEHLDFDDLNIVPAVTSSIKSRSECDVVDENGMLPLFAAPMDTVVSMDNYDIFFKNGIYPIFPRNGETIFDDDTIIPSNGLWTAVGLSTFKKLFIEPNTRKRSFKKQFICLDIANGHMTQLIDIISQAKINYGENLIIMAGNVAHPEAYVMLSDAGADYVRVSIGAGAGCLTTQNTAIGFPLASLIDKVYHISCELANPAYIVADGGMQGYADIIKALALGADRVMVGGIFNKALESAGTTYKEIITRDGNREMGEQVDQYAEETKIAFKSGARFYKKFRGMSTKDVQKELGSTTIRTSEGVSRTRMVEYTLGGWVENFEHYLSTAMSYTNCRTLEEYIGKVQLIHISQNSYKRFNK